MSTEKLFSFGLIADVQHADVENQYNYHKTHLRYYRHALQHLKESVQVFNEKKVNFIVQLGDLIDGCSRKHGHTKQDMENLLDVLNEFKSTGLPVIKDKHLLKIVEMNKQNITYVPYIAHIWGNHEFYNMSRASLWDSPLNSFLSNENDEIRSNEKPNEDEESYDYYYSFAIHGFRFIMLDAYDIGVISRPADSPLHQQAKCLLTERNRNEDLNQPYFRAPRFVQWNGGFSKQQLSWLQNKLTFATKKDEKVLIFSHIAIHPEASHPAALVWNYDVVLELVNAFKDHVIVFFAGHDHDGGYYHDVVNNIHHVTMEGVIERPPDKTAFAIVDVFRDHLEVNGYGITRSRVFKI